MSAPQTTEAFDLENFAIHHVANGDQWNLPFIGGIPLPEKLTVHGFMLVLCATVLFILFKFVYRHDARVPRGITNFLESMVLFIRDDIAITSFGLEEGRKMTPLLCTFFFFILGMNLMGMIPLFQTATANINITAALALITLGFMLVGAISRKGLLGFLKSFVPHGVPVAILPMIVPLEFMGFFIRIFALTVRLFANMLGGHIVIFSLIGLVGLLGLVALPSILLALFVSVIELLVAFLQAYIFTLLSAIFIAQAVQMEH